MEGKQRQKRPYQKPQNNQRGNERSQQPPRVSPYNWDANAITPYTVVPEMPNPLSIIPKPDLESQNNIQNQIFSQIDNLQKQQKASGIKAEMVDPELKQKINSGYQQIESQNNLLKAETQINKQSNNEIIIVQKQLEHNKQQEYQILRDINLLMGTNDSSEPDANVQKPKVKPETSLINKDQNEKIQKIIKEIKDLELKLIPFKDQNVKQIQVKVVQANKTSKVSDFDPSQMSDEAYAQVLSILSKIEALKKKQSKEIKFQKSLSKGEKGVQSKEIQKPIIQKKRMSEQEIQEQIKGIQNSVQFDKLTPEQFKEVSEVINKLIKQLDLEVMLRQVLHERKQIENKLKKIREISQKSYQKMKQLKVEIQKTKEELDNNKIIKNAQKQQNQNDHDNQYDQQIEVLKNRVNQSNQQFVYHVAQYEEQQDLIKYIKFVKHNQYLLRQQAR